MPCLLAILAIAFPRLVIVLLWFFTTFFTNVYHGILIPLLGFIFLPLTLIVYTYIVKTYAPSGALTPMEIIAIVVAVIFDLGLAGGGARRRNA